MPSNIHSTAIVERGAELGEDVELGPYAIVEAGARIGRGTRLMAHAIVRGPTRIGEDNVIHPFAVIGGEAQAKRARVRTGAADESRPGSRPAVEGSGPGLAVLGDRNVVREHVTIHGGTEGRTTVVGNGNLLMVGAHVAHDVTIGDHCIIANAVQLAGHATIEDWVTFGGLSGVAQFVKVGESAFVAAGAMCEKEVPPFVIVQGDRARVRALNVVGLRRRGIPEASIAKLERAYRVLFVSKRTRAEALRAVERDDALVLALLAACGG